MKMGKLLLLATLVVPLASWAQAPPGGGDPQGPAGGPPKRFVYRTLGPRGTFMPQGEMGKWWQNSELAQKLKLSDQQIRELNKAFFEHRMKLIDYQAELQKQDLKLQDLLDEDDPKENQVGAQVDRTLAARANLEREFTMMNLALRKVLTIDQWKQLKAIKSERRGLAGPDMFFDLRGPGSESGPPGPAPQKLWTPPPPDAGEGPLILVEPAQPPDI